MTQFGSEQGFYGQGNYSTHQASHSHHERYIYKSSEAEGTHHDACGQYFHLLLVNMLRGNLLKTTQMWKPENAFTLALCRRSWGSGFTAVRVALTSRQRQGHMPQGRTAATIA